MGKKLNWQATDAKGRKALLKLEENRKQTIDQGLKSVIKPDHITKIIDGAVRDVKLK